jgi:hypothetical protein
MRGYSERIFSPRLAPGQVGEVSREIIRTQFDGYCGGLTFGTTQPQTPSGSLLVRMNPGHY